MNDIDTEEKYERVIVSSGVGVIAVWSHMMVLSFPHQ